MVSTQSAPHGSPSVHIGWLPELPAVPALPAVPPIPALPPIAAAPALPPIDVPADSVPEEPALPPLAPLPPCAPLPAMAAPPPDDRPAIGSNRSVSPPPQFVTESATMAPKSSPEIRPTEPVRRIYGEVDRPRMVGDDRSYSPARAT